MAVAARPSLESALCAIKKRKLIKQIGHFAISSSAKLLASMKAGMFDTSQPLRSFKVSPTTAVHTNADNDYK